MPVGDVFAFGRVVARDMHPRCVLLVEDRCTARDTVPVGNLKRRRKCPLSSSCRWALEAPGGVCPPMTHGTLCEHQGGTFNTFELENVA